MNRSSLLSIVNDFISLSFFNNIRIKTGSTKVVTKTTARQMSALNAAISKIPDAMKINSINVGNNTG